MPLAAVRRAIKAASRLRRWERSARSFFRRCGLAVGDGFVNLQDVERLFFGDEIVYADDDFFFFVDGHLVAVGGFGDFALRDSRARWPRPCRPWRQFSRCSPSAAFDFVGESFDEVRAAERIDGIGDAGFVGDDLLCAQRDGGGEFGGKRPGFIERIGVQRLRAAENGGERLQARCERRCCRAAAR